MVKTKFRPIAQGFTKSVLKTSKDGNHKVSWTTYSDAWLSLWCKLFPCLAYNPSYFNLYPLPLVLPTHGTEQNLAPSSSQPPQGYWNAAVHSSQRCLFSSCSLSSWDKSSGPWPDPLGCPALEQLHLMDIFLVLGDPKPDAAFWTGSFKCWVKGFNNHLPQAAGCDPLNAIWHAAGDLCCQGTLWLTFSLLSSRTWRSFSAERLPSQPVSSMKHDTWFFLPKHRLCIFPWFVS